MNRAWTAILLAALLLLTAAAVSAETDGDFTYTLENGKATVTAYSGSAAALTVPSSLGGCPVTAIGEFAFAGCFELTSVTLPEGVTAVEEGAFFECDGLTSVSLPDSLTRLAGGAFSGCGGLEAIVIPKNVAVPAGNPFPQCEALTQITVAAGSTALETRDGLLYSRGDDTLVCWPQGLAVGVCAVPAGTAAIGADTFLDCQGITAVTLPDSVTAIRSGAFRFCSDMTSVNLPAGVTLLEDSVFEGCCALESVTLPGGLGEIAPWLFRDCDSLRVVTVPQGVQVIGHDAFNSCDTLARIILPGSVTEVGAFAFDGCEALTDVYFGGTQARWQSLNVDDFNEPLTGAVLHLPAPRAADANLPEDLTVIGSEAFADLAGGTLVRMHAAVTQIADDAFPPAGGANPVAFIAPPGSPAEAWGLAKGYTVWFEMP